MYIPREDSFFLSEILKEYLKNKNKEIKVLDLGTGSGIIAETLLQEGIKKQNILAIDIDKQSLNQVKKKGFNTRKSDLFSNVNEKFDLIVFNPPYLPEHKYDKKKDTTGGKKGDETILKFLSLVKNYLTLKGEIILLLSSLTPRKRIQNQIKKQKFKSDKIAEKILFFEKLEIFLISSF